ncbi:LuxR C-terminal-related transcriptional regulator [Serratia oryzae]|uniref:HTH luxR-type domain-containing protein n=1 Tax=Serratia oryzae TaxID=2034155 RepID=A0A1S8CDU3_9GAMM|nr:LuxR C-terminal-related transcriptional regulator [Serratia oryzae]OMQ18516.1 hypothetical protein BMI79_21850 [Serratia oryzae]
MNIKTHVIIQHPCMFTRIAMHKIIRALGDEYAVKETACLTVYMQENKLPPVYSPILLITHIPSCCSLIKTMHAMGKLQFQSAHSLKTIVLTNRMIRPLVMEFLNQYAERCFFLDERATIGNFSENIRHLLSKEVTSITARHFNLSKSLTARERYVIECLIKGMSIWKVANGLGIDYKTVSQHKISALRKLGLRHFNSLFSVKWN